ncbi:LytR C-terminal domain-containing protein [Candidatus Blastococcus massiliensis]|uniref:LytR C-terminal domain-containing protein n=1 Tax=Candidatus Blastococcus massiliensis TaxID=1470358 RepID=UPI0012DEA2AD|nr:LytR C-terminal domain-containing protein [Candidatus Blastococcus massiliensis]
MSAAPSRRPTAAAVAARTVDPPQVSRSRLPLPPVPTSGRPAKPASSAVRSGAPAPRVPRQTTSSSASDSHHGDWTRAPRGLPSEEEMRAALAPATSAIPDRSVAARDEDIPFLDDYPAPRAQRASSRPPVGGRAALRAERQAAEVARKKAAKAGGVDLLDEEPRRAPRRMAKGLVAMGVVALGVLGVYQFTSPQTDEAAATTQQAPAPAPVAPVAPLPELPEDTAPVEPPVTTPVRAPFVVLNATTVNGLAAKIAGTVGAGGWESAGVGAYQGTDVPVTTVFFTEGDETQRQAAIQLVDQFPELQGPAPRFFELPADVTAPGLVIVAAGDWQP